MSSRVDCLHTRSFRLHRPHINAYSNTTMFATCLTHTHIHTVLSEPRLVQSGGDTLFCVKKHRKIKGYRLEISICAPLLTVAII